MAESLGEVLVYLNGDRHSSYPNDRMCVLWDLRAITPESVAMKMKNRITIWQPLNFKNLPFTCFVCKKFNHMARECSCELNLSGRSGPLDENPRDH